MFENIKEKIKEKIDNNEELTPIEKKQAYVFGIKRKMLFKTRPQAVDESVDKKIKERENFLKNDIVNTDKSKGKKK